MLPRRERGQIFIVHHLYFVSVYFDIANAGIFPLLIVGIDRQTQDVGHNRSNHN